MLFREMTVLGICLLTRIKWTLIVQVLFRIPYDFFVTNG